MPQYEIACECGEHIRIEEEQIGLILTCPTCSSAVDTSRAKGDTDATESHPLIIETPTRQDGIPVDWNVGDVYLDIYEVTGLLGQGGMGKVYKVHHRRWDIDLAVKSPRADLLSQGRGMRHFERECEMWVNLGLHPHIVTCYYIRQLGGVPRVFAEFVPGGSLQDYIKTKQLYAGGPERALERLLTMGIQIAWGLQHAHEQDLFHLDMKPANVMLAPTDSGALVAKVTDFGLAKAREIVERESKLESGAGSTPFSQGGMTPAYCAPEQALGRSVSAATDVWSWALCIMEGLAGKVAWKTGPQAPEVLEKLAHIVERHEFLPQITQPLAELLEWCFQEAPEARPQDMLTVVAAAKEAYQHLTGSAFSIPAPRSVEGRVETLNNRSVSLLDLGKVREAERLLAEAVKASPHHPESTFNHEVLRWRLGKTTDLMVLQRMHDVEATHPGDAVPILLTAQVHLERGDSESAIKLLEEIPEAQRTRDTKLALEHAHSSREDSWRLVRTLQGHMDSVHSVAVSHNGRYVLSGSEDNTLRLWDLETGQCVRTLAGHTGSVECVSLATATHLAASGSRDRTIRLWDLGKAKCVASLLGHTAAVRAIEFSYDMTRIISGGDDCSIMVWSVENKTRIHLLSGHERRVNAVALDREAATALSGSEDGVVCVWDLKNGSRIRSFKAHDEAVRSVWLSPCGRYGMSAGDDNTVKLWQIENALCTRTLIGHMDSVNSTVLSRDGRYALSASRDHTVRVWQAGSGRCLRTFEGHVGSVNAVVITRNMKSIVSGGRDGAVKVWTLGVPPTPSPAALCLALRSESALSTEVTFKRALEDAEATLKAGDVLGTAARIREARSQPGYIRHADAMNLWSRLYVRLPRKALGGGWEGPALKGHTGPVESVCISRDGRYALSGGEDTTLRLWDLVTGKCFRTYQGHGKAVTAVCLSRDARQALSGSTDATLKVWDVPSGKCLATFEEGGGPVAALCLSPDFRFALSGGWDIRVWDVKTGRCIRAMEGHASDVTSVDWSPDGRYALSGSSEDVIKLWDIASGECVGKFSGHAGTVESVCFSPDMRYALSGNGNIWGKPGEVRLWELSTGNCLRVLKGHERSIHSVCFSADSRFAFSGSADATLKVWDLKTAQCVRTFTGHDDAIRAIALSDTCQYVVSAGRDGLLQTWVLDWDLEDSPPAEWDEGARPYLDIFLTLHTPLVRELSRDKAPSPNDVVNALTRKGKPSWTEREFSYLLRALGCAGYGWLTPQGVHRELDRMPGKRAGGFLSGLLGG